MEGLDVSPERWLWADVVDRHTGLASLCFLFSGRVSCHPS